MLDNLRQDYARIHEIRDSSSSFFWLECLLFENGFNAVVLHRLAHWFKSRGVPFLGPFFGRVSQILTGVEIGPGAVIGPGLFISHGRGMVIGGEVRIGRDAFLLQQVTIGAASQERLHQMPVLGDDVFVGAGAKIIGGVRIGDHVQIGANALVSRDVPDNSRVRSTTEVTVEPIAIHSVPDQPRPDQPAPDQPVPDQPAPDHPVPDQPADTGKSASSRPGPEEPENRSTQ